MMGCMGLKNGKQQIKSCMAEEGNRSLIFYWTFLKEACVQVLKYQKKQA